MREGLANMSHNHTAERTIAFSPPDITDAEITAVTEVLRSGWITTGPATKQFESQLQQRTQAAGVACLGSATAALQIALRLLGIGPGDEVITSAYTYTATASPIVHVGATPVLVDVAPDSYFIDEQALAQAITPRTKAVIPVDIGGRMADYPALFDVLDHTSNTWRPQNSLQECFSRPVVIADAAHSLGATLGGRPSGSVADLSTISFHAVKNLTTAEGGALCWRDVSAPGANIYRQAMLWSLHGQSKDALAKSSAGSWEYDVEFCGNKCNMTDIQAALGLAQLARFDALLARRRCLVARYEANLARTTVQLMPHAKAGFESSCHLMLARIPGASSAQRNAIIERMGQAGVACNVHYKPLPLLSAYRRLGFDMADYPNAAAQYENQLTLPLHTLLSDDDVDYVCEQLEACLDACL